MQLNIRKRGKYKILDIDGDINEVDNYNVLKEEILRSVNNDEKFIALNLAHTSFLNSGAVSLFISWQKKVAAAGGEIIILEPPQFILEILKILCIEKIIKIYTSEDDFYKKVGEN